MRSIKVGNRIIGNGQPGFLVAELSWAHNGEVKIAKKIIDSVSEAGFDCINFHLTNLDEYMTKDYTVNGVNKYEYLKSILLKDEETEEIVKYAKDKGLFISAMCNDLKSVSTAQKLNIDIVSVHSTTLLEEELLMKIASLMKPVFLMVGGATLGEIERGISILQKFKMDDYALIDGFQSSPSKHENSNLKFLKTINMLYGLPIGYADHMDGDTIDAMVLPVLAMAMGAHIIEKHVTHDRSKKLDGYEAALDCSKTKEFVSLFRRMEKTMGTSFLSNFTEQELSFREMGKKKTVANRDIKKDEIITYRDMCFKLSDSGISPDLINRVIGRRALCNIKKDQGITPEMFLDL